MNVDDSLDVLSVHFFGGMIGALLIGLFGTTAIGGKNGLFYGGGVALLGHQTLAVIVVAAYSLVVSALIAGAIKRTIGLRVSDSQEEEGLDLALHGERAYDDEAALP